MQGAECMRPPSDKADLQKIIASAPGEILHIDFTSIEETVELQTKPIIRNVLVLQDHFSKYVVAYVVDDQTAETAAWTLRNGYFSLFGAPAYLISDQGHSLHRPCHFPSLQAIWSAEVEDLSLSRTNQWSG